MLSRMYLMMLLEFSHDLSRELEYLGECEDGGGLVKTVDGHKQIEETEQEEPQEPVPSVSGFGGTGQVGAGTTPLGRAEAPGLGASSKCSVFPGK